ncbi:lob domain-containing protein 36 [Quercus suber]|uniref:Lob domain-containing protein 36 n=1 Tax=Quercus suber TaxID=58331 RepID=A0AAW0JIP8_QUESU
MSSSNSPCAACKLQRRKCTQDCVFAPYFPADQPQKFANVHNVFGASNVAKILNELNPVQREDAVNSLAYEAEARLSDPVYGCVGIISILQYKLKQIQISLYNAKQELARFSSGQAIHPTLYSPGFNTGFDPPANLGSINPNVYNQRNDAAAGMSPLALGTFENPYLIQTQVAEPQHHLQPQPPQQGQQSQPQQPKLESKEGRS